MPTEKEMKKIEMATTYEIRLMLGEEMDKKNKESLSREEINELLDSFAKERNKTI